MATNIISIEKGKRGSSQVKFETPDGDVYVAGFLSFMPCELPEYYSNPTFTTSQPHFLLYKRLRVSSAARVSYKF